MAAFLLYLFRFLSIWRSSQWRKRKRKRKRKR
jgi:hypothetical protein